MGLGRKQNSKTDIKIKILPYVKTDETLSDAWEDFFMADCKNEQMGIVQIADKQGTDERINMSITDLHEGRNRAVKSADLLQVS